MTEIKQFEEFRKRKRFNIRQTILCYKHIITKKDRQAQKAPFKVSILDLSYSGVKLRTKRELHIGDVLMFNLQDEIHVKQFMFEVVWCKYDDGEFVAGLKFINLTRDMVLFLNSLIKKHIERENRLAKYS